MREREDEVLEVTQRQRWHSPDEAIEQLKRYAETDPKSVRVRLRLASIYADEYGDGVTGAERLYRSVLADDPSNVPAMCGLAFLHGHPGSSIDADESLGLLANAATLTEDPILLRNYATKAWDLGRFEQALHAFEHLSELAKFRSRADQKLGAIAEDAVRSIRRGERPAITGYEWPEIDHIARA